MSDFIFIVTCFFVDFVFDVLFPSDYSMIKPIIIPAATMIGLLLMIKNKNLFEKIFISFIVGFFIDFFSADQQLMYALIYFACAMITLFWQKHLSSSLFEQTILFLSTIFVKETLVYLFMVVSKSFSMSIPVWLQQRCIPTLLVNIIICWVVIGLYQVKINFDERQENQKRKEEKLFWREYK